MESIKMVPMKLSAGKEWRCRHWEQTCGHSRERRGWDELRKQHWHIYNGMLLSHKKEWIWVSFSEVNEPRACYTERTNSEREKQILYATATKSLQSCPTLCDPVDGSPPGSPVPGILQARTLEWVAISSSNAGKWKVKVKLLSCVQLLANPWTAAYQAPPSMRFSRQEYWSGVPLPSPNIVY